MMAPLDMIVLPPRIMFCGPAIVARRETLLPVSFQYVHMIFLTKERTCSYRFDELGFRVVDRCIHGRQANDSDGGV
jgi:hypothetical protein